jgi:H+/gluconate symporter-like permease
MNIIGLVLSILGSFFMFYFFSKVESRNFLYSKKEDNARHKKDLKKNRMIRFGMFLLFIGFIFQLYAIICLEIH